MPALLTITPKAVNDLAKTANLSPDKILNPDALTLYGGVTSGAPVLVALAAGMGTRFGNEPKCIQPVHGVPLARVMIDAFRRFNPSPVIVLVGYRDGEVAAGLGKDNIYIRSGNPQGGTGFAAFEAFSVAALLEQNPLLIISMGDRLAPPSIFRRLSETHCMGAREADLTFLSAIYEPPKNQGKGRVERDERKRVLRIVEQRDIAAIGDPIARQRLLDLTEGNCPLYAIRARRLHQYLSALTNNNSQSQFYLTDIVEAISRDGGDIRAITTRGEDPEYELLCCDVTQPKDIGLLEEILDRVGGVLFPGVAGVEEAVRAITANRPAAQIASIAHQIEDLLTVASQEKLGFRPDQPVALGISGGRLRIAFMHPDMGRFFGPAWQMPIGAGDATGDEQITVLLQSADDQRIHLFPTNPRYREKVNFIAADYDVMYPGQEIGDWNAYEEFGTRMSENLLLSLGYFSDEELQRRREKRLPLPPSSLWVSSNMRRPFSLIGNAIASLRTLQTGPVGDKVQRCLGRENFKGLRLVSTGNIPQGGFSSSSAVTVAAKNAINALFDLGLSPDLLVHLACQAEYGTGVRAGSLDQATEQKGQAGQGALISSNPRDNYRILGTYPVPAERFQVIFPYTVERDRSAWRWSWGAYAEVAAPVGTAGASRLTTGQIRKLTGKAAEIAALLVRLPLEADFFKLIENDMMEDGLLTLESRRTISSILRQLPLLIGRAPLRRRLEENREWHIQQLGEVHGFNAQMAAKQADATLLSLFAGWVEPILRRATSSGGIVEEEGVPLRAMVAYLFGEVAKNFYLIHHPEEWIECVTGSQRGDRCVDIDPSRLPDRESMERTLVWEENCAGPERMERWLERFGAAPINYNEGLDDASLTPENPPEFRRLRGSNFFRGLALIDLAEAMLKRAFGSDAVAVRVNAAGQGDFFQVHIDAQKARTEEVKRFIRAAFYHRFGLASDPEFVEVHPGGGAVGIRLNRFDLLPRLARRLRLAHSGSQELH
ncbi:MAG: NTP transferase domain-containing protein [Candidatus Sumerlaeota bacterium]|nr:NTP transferase domain-containing protein [Candidatus Sumerlaeota bacterium]